MITIKTKKVIEYGDKKRIIEEVEMLEASQLPTQYIKSKDNVVCFCEILHKRVHIIIPIKLVRTEDDKRLLNKYLTHYGLKDEAYFEGTIDNNIPLEEENVQLIFKYIHKAGEHLKRVNKLLKKENSGWIGNETILI